MLTVFKPTMPTFHIAERSNYGPGVLAVLTSGFAEAGGGSGPDVREYAEEGEYDYESDSDLDDFDDLSAEDEESNARAAASSKGRGKAKSELSLSASADGDDAREGDGKKHHRIFIPNMAYRT